MEKSDKLYYRGTIFDVSYEWDGQLGFWENPLTLHVPSDKDV